ncbi:MAG: hypothetical protein IH840_15420 [Candidatus Heimdallarchaeota archaeon]|nr:hypothetical protein [Candidatus Heimdallarchaeota archaeon]
MTKRKLSIKDQVPYVGIIGLGYIGLPLSREFCLGGAQVTGFDVNSSRVAKLNNGTYRGHHEDKLRELDSALRAKSSVLQVVCPNYANERCGLLPCCSQY